MNGFKWLRTLRGRAKLEREMQEELTLHLEHRTREYVAAGMSPEEARYAALRRFGGVDQVKELAREQHPGAWIVDLLTDLRYGLRQLKNARGFAVSAILTIAVGIGACTALFAVFNGVLLKPLHFLDSQRVVLLEETRPPNDELAPAPGVYLDWAEQSRAFAQMAANSWRGFKTRTGNRTVSVSGLAVTANYFTLLGVEPILGRTFVAEEGTQGRSTVVVLSYRLWQKAFAGRPDVLNQTIVLNDQSFTIIGVLPDQNLVWNAQVFTPLVFNDTDRKDYGSHGGFNAIARLAPGVSLAQAQDDLDRISAQIARVHPESNQGHGGLAQPLLNALTSNIRLQLLILLSAVSFVLLIACVNVASLLLARAYARLREIAVRAALGASRWRIIRQFLAESFLISLLGGVIGVFIAYGCVGILTRFVAGNVPRVEEIAIDMNVLIFSLGLILLAGMVVGAVPAFQLTRGDLAASLKESGRSTASGGGRNRLRASLVVVEIALTTLLLAGTGLLARSLQAMQTEDQGFKANDVFTERLALDGKDYNSNEKVRAFVNMLVDRVGALPEVGAVAVSDGLPMLGNRGLLFHVVGTPEVPVHDEPNTADYSVTPSFFAALGIPLRRGRVFTSEDRSGAPRVAVVNEDLVRRYFPNINPIGQRLMIMTMANTPDVTREIIGVVGDVYPSGPQSHLEPQVYEPFAQISDGPGLNLIVKLSGRSSASLAVISDIIQALDADQPPRNLRPYEAAIAASWFRQRFSMTIFIAFSSISLVLAAIGIYGVMSYTVSQRTYEIGIRMALGATARHVVSIILTNAMQMLALGLVIGLGCAIAFSHLLQSLLFRTSPADPVTLLSVSIVLTLVSLFACWFPLRRATKVDPTVAIRAD